jgi:DNA-binding SARP family transcriptional activator
MVVHDDGGPVALGGLRERSLLALLLLNANELVATDRLVDELWGERPPPAAVKTVQVYVSRLRKRFGPGAIVTRAPGYELSVDRDAIDLGRFERLATAGRRALRAGAASAAAATLAEAVALWRGPPLADFVYESFAQAPIMRLEELRLTALEDRVEADLRCGQATELIAELQGLVARHPLRERLRGQLMLALYRAGRQAEALDCYREARAASVEDLGLEPGPELQALERAILRQHPALEPRSATAPRTPGLFVGRGPEIAALTDALEQARAGVPAFFFVGGEPGAGKSRLADEVSGHARERGLALLRGRCWESGGAPGYWPWVHALGAYARGAERTALRRQLGAGAPEIADLIPEVRAVAGHVPRSAVRDPVALRFRLFDAIAGFLRTVAADAAAALVVLDDLHGADESSLRLLEYLVRSLSDARVVVLSAYRDTETTPGTALWRLLGDVACEPSVTRIGLGGLSPTEVGRYLELSAGRRAAQPLVDAIHERTSGNPLFVTETVRLLAAAGQLDTVALEAVVPPGVREAIGRRLERLGGDAQATLGGASVLGREFDRDVLARLIPGRDTERGLDEAIAAKLVVAAPGAPGRLRFSHALVRDALYESLPAGRRRALHAAAAAELERRHAVEPGPYLTTIAQHHLEAGTRGAAGRYARLAAERAVEQLAYEEAARLYRRAVEAYQRDGATDGEALCELLVGLGDAEARAGNEAGARDTFRRAAGVARRSGLPELLARAALGYGGRWVWTVMRDDPHIVPLLEEAIALMPRDDSPLRARLLARLAAGPLKGQGDSSRSRRFRLSAAAVAMARRIGDPAVLAWALDGRKVAIWGPDTLEEHWALIDELHALAVAAGEPEQLMDAHICALIRLFERFELDAFDTLYARASDAARELRQPAQHWLVAVMAPMHALLLGRLDDAERLIAEAHRLGRDTVGWNAHICALLQRFVLYGLERRSDRAHDDLRAAAAANPGYPVLRAALAAACAETGHEAEASTAFEALAADGFATIPFDEEWLLTMAFLAAACRRLGDTRRAALLFELLEPYGHRVVVAPIEVAIGSAALPLGQLAAALGRPQQAAQWFERAARVNERAGALPWAAHARREQGELLLAQGHRKAGGALLRSAAATYCALGMRGWAARCRASARPRPAADRQARRVHR